MISASECVDLVSVYNSVFCEDYSISEKQLKFGTMGEV